ncbi:MAG: pilin [Patescibacteria group bacterium]
MSKTGNNYKKAAAMAGLCFAAVFCLYLAFGQPISVLAQTGSSTAVNTITANDLGLSYAADTGLASTDIRSIIANIIRVALGLLGIVVLVLMIYAGFLWMTAAGNEEQIEKAKKILKNAVIGLAIILMAYAIVAFVIKMLGIGEGAGSGEVVATSDTQNLSGSGALGRIIKDHYPARGQRDVPRNTKIVVTFFHPIQLESLVTDTNGNGILGDCLSPVNNWSIDCDQLNLSNDYINISQIVPTTTVSGTVSYVPISGAALIATETVDPTTQVAGIYTIAIRPLDYLGNEITDTQYQVHLGNNIKRDDPDLGNPAIFSNSQGSKYYEWMFTCGTELDLTPPHVTDVFPGDGVTEYKNSVVQINFNEAMDPIGLQGVFATDSNGYYYLKNGFIYMKNDESTMPLGAFNLVNSYRTLEFTPSTPCGVNACGGTVYCMPVCDAEGASCSVDDYEFLVKAAVTISDSSFESQPFTGAADMCGNALDGDDDGTVENAGAISTSLSEGENPNNYWWNFKLKDEMDLVPPIVSQVVPGPEASWIDAEQEMAMWFDKRMRVEPMYYIDLQESPTPQERCDCYSRDGSNNCVKLSSGCILDLIWKVPFVTFNSNAPITKTKLNHGLFLQGLPQGYIPYISSGVEDAHFNCLYPGQGPLEGADYNTDKLSGYCDKNPDNCCIQDGTQVLCCNGVPALNNDATCIDSLKMPIE